MQATTILIVYGLVLFVLVAASAFFSGSETALFSLSRARLLAYRQDSESSKRFVVLLMESYHTTLICLILGNMFVNVGISTVSGELFDGFKMNETLTTVATVLFAVVVLLIFGEVTPKTIALYFAEGTSNWAARPIWYLRMVLSPLIWLIDKCLSGILDLLGRKKSRALSHEEYGAFLEMAYAGGAFSDEETQLLSEVFALREKTLSEVMTGRVEIACVRKDMTQANLAAMIQDTHYLFFPVVDNSLDDAEYMFCTRDFFMLPEEERDNWVDHCLIPAVFIPQNASLTRALAKLRVDRAPCALAVDEYGGVAGIAGTEDIYREIVGEIDDEHDIPDWEVRQAAPDTWYLNGMVAMSLIPKVIPGWALEEGLGANTLNGVFCEHFDRLPVLGDAIELDGVEFSVEAVSKKRATRIKAVLLDKSLTEDAS